MAGGPLCRAVRRVALGRWPVAVVASVLSRFYPSEEGKMRLTGCCLPSTKVAVQSVPRVIAKGGPCDEDHLNPLGVDGSLSSLTSTLSWYRPRAKRVDQTLVLQEPQHVVLGHR